MKRGGLREQGRRQRNFTGRSHKNCPENWMRDQSVMFSVLDSSWLELQRSAFALDSVGFFYVMRN